jgi:predicted 2-oxoglutarate/Fe(II)-dependent dioxygenase YbiX
MTHFPIRFKPDVDTSIEGHVIEYDNLINKELADDIIRYAVNQDGFHRRNSKTSSVQASFTTCLLVDLNHPIYNILDSVWKSHTEKYGYELTFIEYYEIKEYREGDEFGGHIDTHGAPNLIEERKLNLTVQLSDPESYEGGDLYIKNHCATKSIGSGIFFPPDVVHRVTKVTSGTRYCLIGHGWGVLNRK